MQGEAVVPTALVRSAVRIENNDVDTCPENHLGSEVKTCRSSAQRGFYAWQLACFLLYWLLLRVKTGRYYHVLSSGSVATRPRWLPARVFFWLHKVRVPIFLALPLALGVAVVKSESRCVRLAAAMMASLYHLLESSVTNRHGEYPFLYNMWAMVLPEKYAHAVAFGVATHFVLASGVAKLQVGGASWMRPSTMQTYLDTYRNSRSAPPLSKALNQWLAKRAWATRAVGVGTIALECVMMPSTLFLPPVWRNIGSASMLAMHVGIAVAMSGQVGLLFLTTLPSYILGFSCTAPLGSKPWCAAAFVGLLPSAVSALSRRPLQENWPLTPVSLFMWSGQDALALRQSLMTGDTRVVMSTLALKWDLVGTPVSYSGFFGHDEVKNSAVAHDVLARVIGFTLAQGELVEGALAIRQMASLGPRSMAPFLDALQAWLVRERRMIDLQSGQALLRASFVRVDGRGRVAEAQWVPTCLSAMGCSNCSNAGLKGERMGGVVESPCGQQRPRDAQWACRVALYWHTEGAVRHHRRLCLAVDRQLEHVMRGARLLPELEQQRLWAEEGTLQVEVERQLGHIVCRRLRGL